MTAKQCQWCGSEFHSDHPAKVYCSQGCKKEMNTFVTVIGKRIAADAMAWRAGRGKKGIPAEALKRLTRSLDQANAEFREKRPKRAPTIQSYVEAIGRPTGIRRVSDR